jgi:ABC-2 type transport system permease protein
MTTKIIPGAERKLNNRATLGMIISNSFTMAYRHLLLIRRTPEQLFDVTLQPILFTLLFVFLFGGAISGNIHNYLPLIIPGILVQTAITACITTGVQLREDMDKGVSNRFKSLPISHIAPLTGAALADVLRYSIATALTFVMGYILGYRWASLPGAFAGGILVVLSAWCISWIFSFLGVISRTASIAQGISTAILFPLTFLSNAFVPTNTLPGWLQAFVKVNPVTYLVSSVRQLFNQGTIGNNFWLSLVGVAAVAAIFAPLTIVAYMRKGAH